MSDLSQADTCRQLIDKLACINPNHVGGVVQPTALLQDWRPVITSNSDDCLEDFLSLLTKHTHDVCESPNDTSYRAALLHTLAQSTRELPVWRVLFGVPTSKNGEASSSVLDVTRQLLQRSSTHEAASEIDSESLSSALRIIANCCADNHRNRKSFLTRHGLKPLLALLDDPSLIKLAIPVLYNVCSGDEDLDVASAEQDQDETGVTATEETHNAAASFAAQYLASVRHENGRFATFELLLSYADRTEDDEIEYLAEIVKIAASPASNGLDHVFVSPYHAWNWSFIISDKQYDTLTAAATLASRGLECRLNALHAVLTMLSQERGREALLERADETILDLVKLADFSLYNEDDLAEYTEEVEACEKEFLQRFYEVTGSPTFIAVNDNKQTMLRNLLKVPGDRPPQYHNSAPRVPTFASGNGLIRRKDADMQMTCEMIMLAQWSAEQAFKDIILESTEFSDAVHSILSYSEDPKLLHPLIILISRLCVGGNTCPTPFENLVLPKMKRLLITGGLGLTIPFEAVNAYRIVLKGRPDFLKLYLQKDDNEKTIISVLVEIFDRTIEAGTKSEVGRLFIELLRTLFPLTKSMTISPADESTLQTAKNHKKNISGLPSTESAFRHFLLDFSFDTARILTFVVNESEPKEQRHHGWFGLGMLSVWEAGRVAIMNSIKEDGLHDAILETSKIQVEGPSPARENLKIMLNNLNAHSTVGSLSKAGACLDVACQNLGLASGEVQHKKETRFISKMQ